jgi:hypothetical protein
VARTISAIRRTSPRVAGRINLTRLDAAVRTTALAISRDLAEAELLVRPVLRRT